MATCNTCGCATVTGVTECSRCYWARVGELAKGLDSTGLASGEPLPPTEPPDAGASYFRPGDRVQLVRRHFEAATVFATVAIKAADCASIPLTREPGADWESATPVALHPAYALHPEAQALADALAQLAHTCSVGDAARYPERVLVDLRASAAVLLGHPLPAAAKAPVFGRRNCAIYDLRLRCCELAYSLRPRRDAAAWLVVALDLLAGI
jgi:hypothetical protein